MKLLFGATASTALLFSSFAYANMPTGHFLVELGGYIVDTGEEQHINIDGLIGDTYTVDSGVQGSVILGMGYYFDAIKQSTYEIAYGLNAFYLFQTQVQGDIIQEDLYKNLSYTYNISHLPIYLAAKGTVNTSSEKYSVTFDAGIGPNFIFTNDFDERSLDAMTLPNHAFSDNTNTVFSAMAGIGLKINEVFGSRPMECGYRFFYLGEGELEINNTQIENALKTGQNYANALFCTVSI